ncbi:hypothetical protein MNBD_DELTA04-764 [hydrothermal vent metagenome]|uniref:Uncharacterized protein n=1 Tax=hydrothermal vent metagenome TaxID=652676 RepID=A0A3B0VKW7_9ZZZZ
MAQLNLFPCKKSPAHPLRPFWPARSEMARPLLKTWAGVGVRLPREIATHHRMITRRLHVPGIRERSRTVQMQGGNDVDYPGVISTSCQRSSCAVIGRPAGRRGEDQKIWLFVNNAINSIYCMEHHLKPSRIQDVPKRCKWSGVPHICASVIGRYSPSMRAIAIVQRWGVPDRLGKISIAEINKQQKEAA